MGLNGINGLWVSEFGILGCRDLGVWGCFGYKGSKHLCGMYFGPQGAPTKHLLGCTGARRAIAYSCCIGQENLNLKMGFLKKAGALGP